jgi:hypothetical protein
MTNMSNTFFTARFNGRFDGEDEGNLAVDDLQKFEIVFNHLSSRGKNRLWDDAGIFQALAEEAHYALGDTNLEVRIPEIIAVNKAAVVYDRITQMERKTAKAWLRDKSAAA